VLCHAISIKLVIVTSKEKHNDVAADSVVAFSTSSESSPKAEKMKELFPIFLPKIDEGAILLSTTFN